jgi:photosystem II stability/assembly factor-like uncharacterized protein
MYVLSIAFWLCFQFLASGQHQPDNHQPTASGIVFQSEDGGLTWKDVSGGLPADLETGEIFADGGGVFLSSQTGLYRSSTASKIPVWENQMTLPEKITGFFPGRNGTYAWSYGNGIFQELPGTGMWMPRHHHLVDKNIHTFLETPDGTLFAGCQTGIFKSVDNGENWKQVFDEGQVWSLDAANGVLICGGSRGVLRSIDGGEHWNWVMTGDGAAIRAGQMQGGFAAVTYDGSTYRLCTSTDEGKTWQHVDEILSPTVQFKDDLKQADNFIFSSREAGIFRSTDQGKTWNLVFPSTIKTTYQIAVSGTVVFALRRANGC